MKIYIAGPMSGCPQFNYPAFYAAADRLRDQHIEVVSPAEMDSPEMQKLCLASKHGNFAELEETGETWGDILAKDVKIVADEVDEVCLLPGWQYSRGARLEVFVALSVQKPVSEMVDGVRIYYEPRYFMDKIHKCTIYQGDVSRYKEASNG